MRRESNGHPAETPTAIRPRYRGTTGTLAHTGVYTDIGVAHTPSTPCRTGWGGGTLVYSLPAGPGQKAWGRKPGQKKNMTRWKNHTVRQIRKEEHSVIVMFPHISMPLCSHGLSGLLIRQNGYMRLSLSSALPGSESLSRDVRMFTRLSESAPQE